MDRLSILAMAFTFAVDTGKSGYMQSNIMMDIFDEADKQKQTFLDDPAAKDELVRILEEYEAKEGMDVGSDL